jgi:hypothetical protein
LPPPRCSSSPRSFEVAAASAASSTSPELPTERGRRGTCGRWHAARSHRTGREGDRYRAPCGRWPANARWSRPWTGAARTGQATGGPRRVIGLVAASRRVTQRITRSRSASRSLLVGAGAARTPGRRWPRELGLLSRRGNQA